MFCLKEKKNIEIIEVFISPLMTRKVEKRMYAAISTTEPKFPLTTFRLLIFNHVVYSVIIVSNRGHVKNQKISFFHYFSENFIIYNYLQK